MIETGILPEQLLCSPLIGSEPNHLSDEVTHKLVVLGQLPLGLAGLSLQGVLGGLVTLLQTNTYLVPWCHLLRLLLEFSFELFG